MNYYGTTINDTPTIVGKAAADLGAVAFLAAKIDSNGNIALGSTKGERVLGLLLAEQENIKTGEDVTVQIKDIGLWKASAAISAGAELTTTATGKAVTAAAGDFITAIALEGASADNDIIKVQIVNAGYKPTGANA